MKGRLCLLWLVKESAGALIAVLMALLIGLAAVLIAGCADVRPPERTARDDFLSSCINAARWHALASDQAAMGAIAPGTFAAIDEVWDGAEEICRQVLTGGLPPAEGDIATVQNFTRTTQERMR